MVELYNDKSLDFMTVTMEQNSPENNKVEIIKESVNGANGLSFLRFRTCLQDFKGRNRNRRLWQGRFVRAMVEDRPVVELLRNGSAVGENGHPVPPTGQPTMERILTIDPNNCSHRVLEFQWPSEDMLFGIIETLDEGVGSPGYKLMRNILQGIIPAFSHRAVVPQRKNADGTIDVLGPGRSVCFDRVYLPSHEGAYQDLSVPVKNIVTPSKFATVMESYTQYLMSHSDKIKHITDGMDVAMEGVSIDTSKSTIAVPVEGAILHIAPELKHRKAIRDIFSNL